MVRRQQRDWAAGRAIALDRSGYTTVLDDNLFTPLSKETRRDFERGDGAELEQKMRAVHSSSALAVNVFEYWRHRAPDLLAHALSLPCEIDDVRFEQKRPTGLPGNAPNLDVVLGLADGSELAVESKFLEPYGSRHVAGFKPKYFAKRSGEWALRGLPACQALAEALHSGKVVFRWLHAEQLLKHILGLEAHGVPWALAYLWFAPPSEVARDHGVEVAQFAEAVAADGVTFRSLTYQALYASMCDLAGGRHPAYLGYLGSRYFGRSDEQALQPDATGRGA